MLPTLSVDNWFAPARTRLPECRLRAGFYAWGLGAVGLGGASLSMPLYVVELGAEPFALGVLAASAAVAGVPGAFLFGRIADRTGRRRELVLVALATMTAMLVFAPLVRSIPLVIGTHVVVWFSFAAVGPVLTLLVVADVDESAWQDRIALLNVYQGWGWAGGLVLGAVWTGIGEQSLTTLAAQRTLFLACAACTAGAFAGIYRWLGSDPSTEIPAAHRLRRALLHARRFNVRGAVFPFTPSRVFGWSLRVFDPLALVDRFPLRLLVYYGAVLLYFIGFTAFFAPLPIYLEELGYSSSTIFALYVLSSVGAAMFYVGAASLTRQYNAGALQSTGLVVRGISIPGIALVGTVLGGSATGLFLAGGLFLLVGVTWAVIAVTAATIVTRMAPSAIRGEALGMYTAVSAGSGGVGSLLGGAVAEINYLGAFVVAGTFVLLGAVLVYRLRDLTEAGPSFEPETSSS